MPLIVAISATTSALGDMSSPAASEETSATVSAVAANASICIRFRATDASVRPARQRRIATMVSSTDQWTRNAAA